MNDPTNFDEAIKRQIPSEVGKFYRCWFQAESKIVTAQLIQQMVSGYSVAKWVVAYSNHFKTLGTGALIAFEKVEDSWN